MNEKESHAIDRTPYVLTGAMLLAGALCAADWPQWRGPDRDGVADKSPALIESLDLPGTVVDAVRAAEVREERVLGKDTDWPSRTARRM